MLKLYRNLEIYKFQLRKFSSGEVEVWYFFFASLYPETGVGRTDDNELWAKKVAGIGQWLCFVD